MSTTLPSTPPPTTALLDFRIDWGYQFLYSRRQYHPEYCWDGELECRDGRIDSVFQLEYPYIWWGIVHSPRETRLPEPRWRSTTRRALAGIRVVASCSDESVFVLRTPQGSFEFTAEQVRRDGRIVFPVGWKYSHCTVIVTRTGYLWFQPPPKPDEVVIEARALQGVNVLSWARMEQGWIKPGAAAKFDVTLPPPPVEGETSWLVHLQAMLAKDPADPFSIARDWMPMELRSGGRILASFRRYLRFHDMSVQILHDLWVEVAADALPSGRHQLELVNGHDEIALLIHRITVRPRTRCHLDLLVPRWTLVGREFLVRVRTLKGATRLAFDVDEDALRFAAPPPPEQVFARGEHEFRVRALRPLLSSTIRVRDLDDEAAVRTAQIEAVYDLPPEEPEVQVGYDMTTVPHDESGVMDWILDYTFRTQLGNLVCFRPFPMGWKVEDALLERWGRYCREHDLYVQGINLDAGPLPEAAGERFQGIGRHELSGHVYFHDPDNKSRTMRQAAERYIAFIREDVEKTRATAPRVAYGDASGGHRYSLLAGADFLRAETMVPNTTLHLTQARAAALALGTGEWGVHIAIQHAKQPYLESHLSQYYLSLLQPWMMGATFIYEEDSLFVMFKEERQCWDDALVKGKRDMTREFYRWASTHPRLGRTPAVAIGVILGRYAAPFNGFICGCEQDPGYSVWGRFGRSDDPTWGHLQPEKVHQVLDVLMPGCSTHPLRQRYDRRRFFFTGTPYGDFDQVPVEASPEFLRRYRLLIHLGWNTMLEEDYTALKEYAIGGGTVLLGVPQLSTHVERGFLATMDDLALVRGGDVADLCGVRIQGRGVRYCGHWAHTGPDFQGAVSPRLSRVPSTAPEEDGPCHLAEVELRGARVLLVDAISGRPLLVEHRIGAGRVLLMTTWAYAGHEELADFSGAVVAALAREAQGECRVEDRSGEVFWTWWPSPPHPGCGQLMLLNTDWTVPGNLKSVRVTTPAGQYLLDVSEGAAQVVTVLPFGLLVSETPLPHIEIVDAGAEAVRIRVHGTGQDTLYLHTESGLTGVVLTWSGSTVRNLRVEPGLLIEE